MAAGLGFEPRLMDSESIFLPLKDPAIYLADRADLEPEVGIGPTTSFLPRMRSATELLGPQSNQWVVRDSNPRSPLGRDVYSVVQ